MPSTTVEVAFNAGLATDPASRTWTDITDYVELDQGVTITGGRSDERSSADANGCTLVVDNSDGRFTPELSSSPYYPNVKLRRPIRVRSTYPPPAAANLLSAANADFESGVGSWTAGGTVPPTLAQSATRAWSGSNSLRITWGTGGTFPLAQVSLAGLTIGVVYTFAVYVWVPTGSPDVKTAIGGITSGTSTAVKDTWVRLTQTFTATATSHNLQVWPSTSPTAGQQVYVDAAMAVVGSDVGDFNTLTPSTTTRFLGFVDEWPTEWPDQVDSYSVAKISASSRMAALGNTTALRSVLQETILADGPALYWPLGEAAGATTALGLGSTDLNLRVSSGGTVVFGNDNGPLTDESTAVKITGAGSLRSDGTFTTGTAFTVEGLVCATTGAPNVTVLSMFINGTDTSAVSVAFNWGAGAPVLCTATLTGASGAPGTAVDYTTSTSDNTTHHWAVTVSGTSVKIYFDGVQVATASSATSYGAGASQINLGTAGSDFAISHVAIHTSALSASTLLEHANAALNGWPTETTDVRLARYATWAGIPSTETSFEAGTVALAHIDTSGSTILDPMRKVETTDGGVLYDALDGSLSYQAMASRYTAASAVTLSFNSHEIGAQVQPRYDSQGLTNDVTGTYIGGEVREFNQASIDDYGPQQTSVEMASTSADVATAAAGWMVNVYKDPKTRIPALEVADLTQLDSSKVQAVLALDVGSKFSTTNWPTQAAVSTLDVIVEGYTETITLESHVRAFNVAPASIWADVFTVEDATKGVLDATYKLAR
jgi:hypothetical protein